MNEPKDLAKIYLGRHCKTQWNVENRLIGTTDLPLCAEGLAEARPEAEAGERLRESVPGGGRDPLRGQQRGGVFDRSGQLTKTMVVPPGAADPIKPEKGSQEAKWLQRVCMF